MTLYLLKKEMVSSEFCIIFNPINLHAVPKPNEELNHLEPCNRMQFCRHSCMQRDVYKLVYIYISNGLYFKVTDLHLLSGENQTLLLWWDTLFFFNPLLYPIDFVGGLDIDFDFFASQCLKNKAKQHFYQN